MVSRKPYYTNAYKLGTLIDTVAKPCLKNGGYYFAQLMLDWEKIIGTEMAFNTSPIKLSFPRGKGTSAVLTLQVQPAFALIVGFQKGLILEKITAFYGKQLVSDIIFKQSPMNRMSQPEIKQIEKPIKPIPSNVSAQLDDIQDDTLRHALIRLGIQIFNQ
ncbi:MAG: DciA family protein [Alphaproteobacteria bacterium]|nr:DciA family protein [Alphaproteobacteria bacterium]